MILETPRLILRPWEPGDAPWLYEYARDPDIGPAAGWEPHKSVAKSEAVIRDFLTGPEIYAVVLKSEGHIVGCAGLYLGAGANMHLPEGEGELGYWMGKPYWGQGLTSEASREIIRRGFEDLHLNAIWCGYFEGNEKSRRVQEKCGFRFHHTNENLLWERTGERKTEHVSRITKEEYFGIE